jgi:hypothetical protein
MEIICNVCGCKASLADWTCEVGPGGVIEPKVCPVCKNEETWPDKN